MGVGQEIEVAVISGVILLVIGGVSTPLSKWLWAKWQARNETWLLKRTGSVWRLTYIGPRRVFEVRYAVAGEAVRPFDINVSYGMTREVEGVVPGGGLSVQWIDGDRWEAHTEIPEGESEVRFSGKPSVPQKVKREHRREAKQRFRP